MEELEGILRERRGAGVDETHPVQAQHPVDLTQHQPTRQPVAERLAGGPVEEHDDEDVEDDDGGDGLGFTAL